MNQSQNRYRGVILTPQGLRRLENAIVLAQEREKFGSRFTQAELSERAKLSIKTIKKIREGTIPIDEALSGAENSGQSHHENVRTLANSMRQSRASRLH
jgi:hypothetical protein